MDLTLLIYTIYLISSLNTLGTIAIVASLFIAFLWMVFCVIEAGTDDFYTNSAKTRTFRDGFNTWRKRLLTVLVIGILIVTIVPNERYMLLMAASEVGKQVVETETAKESVELLNAWIQQQKEEILKSLNTENETIKEN